MSRTDSAMGTQELSRNHRLGEEHTTRSGLDLCVLGICSGSGLDQLDLALLRYRQDAPNAPLRVELLQCSRIRATPSISSNIHSILRDIRTPPALDARVNALLGQMFSIAIKDFCGRYDVDLTSIDIVSTCTPGLKRPIYPVAEDTNNHAMGWNAVIEKETGLMVMFDFVVIERAEIRRNISPIAFVDRLLLRHPHKFRACLNIDEVANIGFISPFIDDGARTTISRDCGPGSLLINYAMRYCTSNNFSEDYNGTFARQGTINQDIVARFLNAHDYLHKSAPLYIAREMFGDHEGQRLIDECLFADMCDADTVATITRITAQNIFKQYGRLLELYFPPGQQVDELFICGLSARNSNIVDYLEAELPESVITKPLDDIGIPGDAKEAFCYAHLGLNALLAEATHPPRTASPTSRQQDAVVGKFFRGKKWDDILGRIQKFSEGKPLNTSKDIRVVSSPTGRVPVSGL